MFPFGCRWVIFHVPPADVIGAKPIPPLRITASFFPSSRQQIRIDHKDSLPISSFNSISIVTLRALACRLAFAINS